MFSRQSTIAQADPELWAAIPVREPPPEDHIELIASENYVSAPVMEAPGLPADKQVR